MGDPGTAPPPRRGPQTSPQARVREAVPAGDVGPPAVGRSVAHRSSPPVGCLSPLLHAGGPATQSPHCTAATPALGLGVHRPRFHPRLSPLLPFSWPRAGKPARAGPAGPASAPWQPRQAPRAVPGLVTPEGTAFVSCGPPGRRVKHKAPGVARRLPAPPRSSCPRFA